MVLEEFNYPNPIIKGANIVSRSFLIDTFFQNGPATNHQVLIVPAYNITPINIEEIRKEIKGLRHRTEIGKIFQKHKSTANLLARQLEEEYGIDRVPLVLIGPHRTMKMEKYDGNQVKQYNFRLDDMLSQWNFRHGYLDEKYYFQVAFVPRNGEIATPRHVRKYFQQARPMENLSFFANPNYLFREKAYG